MKADRRTSTTLYIAIGLVGAFLVSFVAGLPAPTRDESDVAARNIGSPADVTVEVLNGAGVSGLAGSITDQLRSAGFDVVYFGNAARFDHARSFVLDRVGNPDRARAVAAALGIDSVATVRDTTLLLDVSVVLGKDWPPAEPEAPDRVVDRALDLLDRD